MVGEQGKILVVDDEEGIRNVLRRTLEAAGYNIVTAANGEEALHKVSLQEAEVVILDIKMPVMSGIEVLKKLTADSCDYCVIMVTAVAGVQTAVEALTMGAYDYITKPFEPDDVKQKVDRVIKRWRLRLLEKQRYMQTSEKIIEQTQRMQEQFEELVSSLSREHKLIHELAAKQGQDGKALLSRLPVELREPILSVEEFRDALIRILRGGRKI